MLRDDALLAFERHATSKLSRRQGSALDRHARVSRRSAAVHRLRLAPAARNALGRRDHRARASSSRAEKCCAAMKPRRPRHHHHRSRSVLTTSRRGRNFCAPIRPSWRTSRRWSRITAWRIRKSFRCSRHNNRTAGCHAGRDPARARLSGVRQPDARRSGRSGRSGARELDMPPRRIRTSRSSAPLPPARLRLAARRCRR